LQFENILKSEMCVLLIHIIFFFLNLTPSTNGKGFCI
jgi:hypothetical protein